MQLKMDIKKHLLSSNDLVFELLESGDLFRIRYHHNQINLLRGNLLDGSVSNLYLRRFHDGKYSYKKLLGIQSNAAFEIVGNQAVYQGQAFGIDYQVVLSLHGHAWVYDVLLGKKTLDGVYDLFYGQDVGIASTGSILASEAYTAQYIDHQAFKDQFGYTICSRQNQGDTQVLQIGSLTKNVGFVTDGTQFFGLSYKLTNEPKALFEPKLANENYQYEFPYITLQSEPLKLNQPTSVVFYGYYKPLHEGIVSQKFAVLDTYNFIKTMYRLTQPKRLKPFLYNEDVIVGKPVDEKTLKALYPNQSHIEHKDQLLSFFTDEHTHVVSQAKELLVERPHGHMIIHGDMLHVSENIMAQTNFMYGVFASHVVLGNTNFHKLLGVVRNFLNVDKLSGMRIYLKKEGRNHLLTMPSYYEIGINFCKWVYVLENDTLEVMVSADKDELSQKVSFKSLSGHLYDLTVTQALVMHPQEYEVNIPLFIQPHEITIDTTLNGFIHDHYPTLKYRYRVSDIDLSETMLIQNEALSNFGVITFEYTQKEAFEFYIDGTFDTFKDVIIDVKSSQKKFNQFIESLTGIQLKHPKLQHKLDILNESAFWFTHNGLVHYSSPHGLEQSNGAAWGTRDICQGPAELFMAASRYDIVREILLKVFRRQFVEDGDFPQWFMFDNYYRIQAHESHGDIIIWPLRTLGIYLKATQDLSILQERVPYMSKRENAFVKADKTLLDHIVSTLDCIEASYIPNTHLPRYGGGDWDDTLQPANHDLTSKMVSGWTIALLFDALNTLSIELSHLGIAKRLNQMKQDMQKDYETYMVKSGVPAGFIVFNDQNQIDYLLHPNDEKTGLKYRLLALKRPIISEMIDKHQAVQYKDLITQVLKHPDGVRLMDTAVTYRGGLKTYFSRAETAANFGREIGIQYCHAHIRFIEAMAKLGEPDLAFEALYTINPIDIQQSVPNAMLRQSNVYFSSSDAAFKDRYEAKRDFEKVRQGLIPVKAGWRMYSSGPGIYLNQMVSNVLGFKQYHQGLWIDPALPQALDGLELSYHMGNYPLQVSYHFGTENQVKVEQQVVSSTPMNNRYRSAGVWIPSELLKPNQVNRIEVTLKK